MIALLALLLVGLLLAGLVAGYFALTGVNQRPADPEMGRIAIRSVLLLQQALTDPTIRQTQKWEDDAQSIIDSYRKKEGI